MSSVDLSKIPSVLKVQKTSGLSSLCTNPLNVKVAVSKSGETILQVLDRSVFRVFRYHNTNGFSALQEEKSESLFNSQPPRPPTA